MLKNLLKKLLFLPLCSVAMYTYSQVIDSLPSVRIWSEANHSAFTDLCRYKGKFYCTFREAENHVGSDGKIRVIASGDGKKWESVDLLEKPGVDLRDPKISVTPSGKLMLLYGGSVYKGKDLVVRNPHSSFLDPKTGKFTAPEKVGIDPVISNGYNWIWGLTLQKTVGYGVDYRLQPGGQWPSDLYLVSTTDGKSFKKHTQFEVDGNANETAVRFNSKGIMYALIRREGDDKVGVLAHSVDKTYTKFEYTKLDRRLGGPNFLFLDDNTLVMGSRVYRDGGNRTAITVTGTDGRPKKIFYLPSAGDNSYTGLLIYNDSLWVTYYSSHEDHTSIYLTTIPVQKLLE